jgi:hypothetical protein
MALEISHGCFSGSAAAFDNLRLVWANAAGYFPDVIVPVSTALMDLGEFSDADMAGDWPDGAPDDPLVILLVHDLSGGRIQCSHCPYLAGRLEQLEAVIFKAGLTEFMLATQRFIIGLKTAAHYRQDVTFTWSDAYEPTYD